jgi:hypothetical protein
MDGSRSMTDHGLTDQQRQAIRDSVRKIDTSDRSSGPCIEVLLGSISIGSCMSSREAADRLIDEFIKTLDRALARP